MTTILLSGQAAPDRAGVTVQLARHVRTEAGEEWYNEPIGALIVKHTHHELLQMRTAMQMKYPRSDERVRKIRNAVVKSREAGHHLEPNKRFGPGESGAPAEKPSLREQVQLDYRKLVEAFPNDSETNGIIENAMQDVTDRGLSEDDPEFWKQVHDQVKAELDARGPSRTDVAKVNPKLMRGEGVTHDDLRLQQLNQAYREAKYRMANAKDARATRRAKRQQDFARQELLDLGALYDASKGGWYFPEGRERAPQITFDRNDAEVQRWLAHPEHQSAARRSAQAMLDHQKQFAPDVVANTQVRIAKPPYTGPVKIKPQGNQELYIGGISAPGDFVTLHPRAFSNYTYANHPPKDDRWSVAQASLAHEIGHGIHRRLPMGGFDPALWEQLAASMNLPPPELMHTNIDEFRTETEKQFTNPKTGRINPKLQSYLNDITPQSVARADAMINNGKIKEWIEANKAAVEKAVSRYGAADAKELMAELWGEGTTSSTPRAPARTFMQYAKQNMSKNEVGII